jgi:hypothetical protein
MVIFLKKNKAFAVFLFLGFLLSPASSLIGFWTGNYFPNEKISFLLALIFVLMANLKLDRNLLIGSFLIFSIFLICFFSHVFKNAEFKYDINFLYFFLALPIYVSYFKSNNRDIFSLLPYVVLLHLFFSIYQQINTLENGNWVNPFNNYSHQNGYAYPPNGMGQYRTSGLFNESSQYACFLVLYAIFYFEGVIKKGGVNFLILLMSIIDFFVSQSITAFLMATLYCLVVGFKHIKDRKNFLILIFTLGLIVFILPGFLTKIELTFFADNQDYPRLLNAIKNLKQAFYSDFLFGNGLSWSRPSWDFISIYFSGFGLIGGLAALSFIFYFLAKLPYYLRLSSLVFLFTNGHFLIPLNMFMIFYALSNESSRPTTPSSTRDIKVLK